MFDQDSFIAYCNRLNLSEEARQLLETIRSSGPSRRVRGGKKNTPVVLQSRKMGFSIHTESRTVEYAGARLFYEVNSEAFEFWDQPTQTTLHYIAKSGKPVTALHTPDFLVLYTHKVCFEEWKLEEELVRLTKQQPTRYVRSEDGTWRCPHGEEYAAKFGIEYKVRSSAELKADYVSNINYIKDYLRADCPPVPEKIKIAIWDCVKADPGISFTEVLTKIDGITADHVNTMIALNDVYVDLLAIRLIYQDRVRIFLNAETALAYATMVVPTDEFVQPGIILVPGSLVIWDVKLWQIVNIGESTTTLLSQQDKTLINLPNQRFEALVLSGDITAVDSSASQGDDRLAEAEELLRQADPEALLKATQRYAEVQRSRQGLAPLNPSLPPRTLRYWERKCRDAETKYGSAIIGLLDQYANVGKNGKHYLPEIQQLLEEYLDKYETNKQKTIKAVWGQLVDACAAKSLLAPSYKTFRLAIKRRSGYQQTYRRQGKRAAYQRLPHYLDYSTPRHGERPFEVAHIDHTEVDIELIDPDTGEVIGRPWLTILMDAYSRRILAFILTFDPPSYRTCMLVLRECVRRHGRLPDAVVVDGGKEFKSAYFEVFIARYEVDKIEREGKPRVGSLIERLFNTSNTQVFHLLEGNTQITKNVRQVTKAVNPKNLASWTLSRLFNAFARWAFEEYDKNIHSTLKDSPRHVFEQGLYRTGKRPHRLIRYTEAFVRDTLPTTKKGTAKVEENLGVKINYIYYWHDAMRSALVIGTQIPIRYDPFNIGIAYAFIKLPGQKGRWEQCLSQYHYIFRGRTERELNIASNVMRQQNSVFGNHISINAKRLPAFLNSLEAEEALHEQRTKDANLRSITDWSPEATSPDSASTPDIEPNKDLEHESEQLDVEDAEEEDSFNEDDDDNMPLYEGFKL